MRGLLLLALVFAAIVAVVWIVSSVVSRARVDESEGATRPIVFSTPTVAYRPRGGLATGRASAYVAPRASEVPMGSSYCRNLLCANRHVATTALRCDTCGHYTIAHVRWS
jgi:hypothetical protein